MRPFALLAVALAALALPAAAQNWGPLLKGTPFERFNKQDLDLFMEHAHKALDDTPDNQTVSWENPDTKHGGAFTVLRTWEKDGNTCKRLRVQTQADTRKRDNLTNACRVNGKWRLLSPSGTK
jgi:surface antigen